MLGLYIHVPFCISKCPYCDFYSLPFHAPGGSGWNSELLDTYTQGIERALDQWKDRLSGEQADTLYLGGGTPSLLGGGRLARLVRKAKACFGLKDGEITLEANPADDLEETLRAFAEAGGNRLSLGMQSAHEQELRGLSRRHTPGDVERAMEGAYRAGIRNRSLDLMLGLEGQTPALVEQSAAVCRELGADHVSAYLLKIEEGTPFAARQAGMCLPDEDQCAALYLTACEALDRLGYRQYEISNFSAPGRESRHNLKYWTGQDYLGLGPAAHSYIGGHRFYYPRDLAGFLAGNPPETENPGPDAVGEGTREEFLMLRLRLTEGATESAFQEAFGETLPMVWRRRAASLPPHLIVSDEAGIRLTREGFLLSNAVIGHLLG